MTTTVAVVTVFKYNHSQYGHFLRIGKGSKCITYGFYIVPELLPKQDQNLLAKFTYQLDNISYSSEETTLTHLIVIAAHQLT
jgi:hypothetical protein